MVQIDLTYLGDLRCEAVHAPSGQKLTTDAPVDNEGRGESFSPTDLLATSLGACMMTIMGIVARRHDVDLAGTRIRVLKGMSADSPRRVARLEVVFTIPHPADHPKRSLLENAAKTCPVHASLHPGVENVLTFDWVG
jgi:uncharacterized OsmC-like protein